MLAIETVAHIGMTSQGRREIRRIGDTTVETIKKILERGIDGEKVRALVAYGDLVSFTHANHGIPVLTGNGVRCSYLKNSA